MRDNFGSTEDLEERGGQLLAGRVDRPRDAFTALEKLARECADRRVRITAHVVRARLEADGFHLREDSLPPIADPSGYADYLGEVGHRLDIAGLPSLEQDLLKGSSRLPAHAPLQQRLMVVTGAHGSGKTVLAIRAAQNWLRTGRPGLHGSLARWAGDIERLLEASLPNLMAGRALAGLDLNDVLSRSDAFVVLDGLDEVPSEHRRTAELQIAELARRRPSLQMLVTTRPNVSARHLADWEHYSIAPLTNEQIDGVFGHSRWRWALPRSVADLAHNPLMLGLIRAYSPDFQSLPTTEVGLLRAFVHTLIQREVGREGAPDANECGWILEEASFEWRTRGLAAPSGSDLMLLARAVADRTACLGGRLNHGEIDAFLRAIGLVVEVDGTHRPIHESLLDHLAGAALVRRDPTSFVQIPQFREALAHYVALQDNAPPSVRNLLHEVARTDFQLLARCKALVSRDILCKIAPREFGLEYLGTVREIEASQLLGAALLSKTATVVVAGDLSWLDELYLGLPEDRVLSNEELEGWVLDHRPDPRILGSHGRRIETPVPQLAAFDRLADALTRSVADHGLHNEGRDAVYETLVEIRDRARSVFTSFVREPPSGLTDQDILRMSLRELRDRLEDFGRANSVKEEDLDRCLYRVDPKAGLVEAVIAPARNWGLSGGHGGLGLHGLVVRAALLEAEAAGVADLPIHGLGLMPESRRDPLLEYPENLLLMDGNQVVDVVVRFEQAKLRTYRCLVDQNLPALAPALGHYRSLPLGETLTVVPSKTSGQGFIVYYKRFQPEGESDNVRGTMEPETPTWDESATASYIFFQGVRKAAYNMLGEDIRELVAGTMPLS